MIRSMPCPACGTLDLTRLHRTGFDFVLAWLGLYPYRCRRCDKHWYRFQRAN